MTSSVWTRILRCAAVAAVLVLPGCAEEREPINRVQANALAKSFFVGDLQASADDPEFYTATTIVDVPYGADQLGVFTGLVGKLRRVKFEITEHFLNARLSYEEVEGVDGHGSRTTNDGRVIASYAITSHFDIRRAYNSSTGEELNVVEENTSDRPWNEREYFRVDWSMNLVASSTWWDPISQMKAFGSSFDTEALAYYVNDPNSPDLPVFAPDEGYFDVTNKIHLKPKEITVDGATRVACYWKGSIVVGANWPWGNCENSEVTVRASFRRVAQEGDPGFRDYEPVDWDGTRMNAFGIFTEQRLGWDRQYGVVDDKYRRLAARHNIWQKSHTADVCADQSIAYGDDPHRDLDQNGTEDECEAVGPGSRCDELVGKCTIPFAQREIRPIAWHYTHDSSDSYIFESTERAAWEWDTAMRVAVQTARLVECRRTGGASIGAAVEDCEGLFPVDQRDDAEYANVSNVMRCWKDLGRGAPDCAAPENSVAAMNPIVTLCKNPVAADDDPACGGAGTNARPGDIRYHQVNVWPTRQQASPWGYGPSLADPLTGELISVGINVYNSVTDTTAQTFLDTMRWINGELSTGDITSGQYVQDWVRATSAPAGSAGHQMSRDELEKRVAGMAGLSLEAVKHSEQLRGQVDMQALHRLTTELEATTLPEDVIGNDRSEFETRIQMAKGSPVEGALMNTMWNQMAGVDPEATDADDAIERASPLRGLRSHTMMQEEQSVLRALADNHQCLLGAPEPTGLPALAKVMQRKFPYDANLSAPDNAARLDRMWNYLRGALHYTLVLHEMGHTFGLRHNFTSSYDRFNYRPQYWQLRTRGGTVNTPCTEPVADGSQCIGPRYFDPLDQDEIDGSIWTWQHTTVMDYPGDLTQDMLGLGVYDYAAVRFFYGDTVDVRNDGVHVLGTPTGDEIIERLVDYAGGVYGQYVLDDAGDFIHYSRWNDTFGLIRNCQPVTPEAPAWWDAEKDGAWDPVFDGRIVRNEVCERAPIEFVSWRDMVPDVLQDVFDPKYYNPRRARDAQGRPRVPYAFETDNAADGWRPCAYRHDNGADLYEEIVFHTNLYENRHLFDNFRNGRTSFTLWGAYERALSRYHAKVSNLTQGFAYATNFILREFARQIPLNYDEVLAVNAGPGGFLFDHAVAASVGFDHFARVLTRPHVGAHFVTAGDPVLRPTEDRFRVPSGALQIHIPNGTSFTASGDLSYGGRPVMNDFDWSKSAYAGDYFSQAGSYYEKTFAMESLLEASYSSINSFRLDAVDARFRYSNFTGLYPEGMRRLIGSVLTEDSELFAPRVSRTCTGPNSCTIDQVTDPNNSTIHYPAKPLGWVSFVPPQGPEICWGNGGKLACSDPWGAAVGTQPEISSIAVDPQLGWEVQKFVIFWAYVYLPASDVFDWVDMMRIYQVGADTDPDYLPQQRVEWRDPQTGLRYVAKRYGDENILGKTYDRGIAAKVIQWANKLTAKAYALDETMPIDPATGRANYRVDPATGQAIVAVDPYVVPQDPNAVKCDENSTCEQLRRYRGLLDFMRDTAARLGFPEPSLKVYGVD